MRTMRITFLGTGTSGGVPVINCDCPVCTSANPKNKRLRSSVMVEVGAKYILIDTSVDMRQQFLRTPFPRIDAVLFTHAHADHIFGLDEIRRFNHLQKQRIPIYGSQETIDRLRVIFTHAFSQGPLRPGVPNVAAHTVDEPFNIGHIAITPVPLLHGDLPIFGYRIGNFAYLTDVSKIPKSSYDLLNNLDLLVLDTLRVRPHPTHFHLDRALVEAAKIAARQTYLIHMNHNIDHEEHGRLLPEGVHFSYDGLVLELD